MKNKLPITLLALLAIIIVACTYCAPRTAALLIVSAQNELNREVRENFANPSVLKITSRPIIIATPAVAGTKILKQIIVPCPYPVIGTAFVITPSGYAVTVTHVVDTKENYQECLADFQARFTNMGGFVSLYDWKMASSYTATTASGETYPMQVISTEPEDKGDKALVFIPPKERQQWKPVVFSDNEVLSDQVVAVVGTPLGVNDMIVAGKVGRNALYNLNGLNYNLIVAPVYPGNSGGPAITLFNMKVIGMVDLLLISDDTVTGIVCLIPSKDIKEFLKKELPDYSF